jgi:prepilin-type processing-associated H-X9-DG protein
MSHEADHEDWRERVSAYADDECSADERRIVRAHLKRCADCRAWLQQVQADKALFIQALDSSARGMDLSQRIMEEVSQMPEPEKPEVVVPGMAQPQVNGRQTVSLRFSFVEAAVILVILAMMAAILFPVFARGREKARQASCNSNLKQIALATLMYAQDYDGHLPDATHWQDQLFPYIKNRQLYVCPTPEPGTGNTYAMNRRLSAARASDYPSPSQTIVFYDADEAGRPVARHNGGTNCAFLDGHVKWMKGVPEDIGATTNLAPPAGGYGLAEQLKLAYDANAEVWVQSAKQAILSAEKTVYERHGFVLASDLQAMQEPYSAQLTCKVPTAEVANTINALGDLGWVARRSIKGEDLTRSFVDRNREVRLNQKREERLDKVVQQTGEGKHPTVPASEQTLTDTEHAQAGAESALFDIASRTTLATVSLSLVQRDRNQRTTALGATWRGALEALIGVGVALGRLAIWLAVFAWVWLPVVWLGWRVRGRRLRVRQA